MNAETGVNRWPLINRKHYQALFSEAQTLNSSYALLGSNNHRNGQRKLDFYDGNIFVLVGQRKFIVPAIEWKVPLILIINTAFFF